MDFCLPEGVFNHLPFFIKHSLITQLPYFSNFVFSSSFLLVFLPSFLSIFLSYSMYLEFHFLVFLASAGLVGSREAITSGRGGDMGKTEAIMNQVNVFLFFGSSF